MARSKVAQAQVRSKTQGKTAKAPAESPSSAFRLTGAAFDGGEELREDCTAADLFALLFAAPNADGGAFLEQVLGCVCDDLELINAAVLSDHGLDEVVSRVSQRSRYRIKVGMVVARRIEAARALEVQS